MANVYKKIKRNYYGGKVYWKIKIKEDVGGKEKEIEAWLGKMFPPNNEHGENEG